ncbi:MAG: alkaline phosphatase family protein [Clostridia bacterium]|nr:alkaline phosphatase family protein [Clostridia bacterium]
MEHDYTNTLSATRLAATIADIAGFDAPAEAEEKMAWLADIWKERFNGHADGVFIFSADAVPCWMVRKYPDKFASVWKYAPMMIPLRTVFPTVTPIDYAAFFSGAQPDVNGVDRYVKPILTPALTQPLLKSDSLIAAAVRSGRKVCVVTCSDGCITSMLSRSGADFRIIPGDDDEAMFREAISVIKSGAYDFVFLYQLGFDYAEHAYGPEGEAALGTLDRIIERFAEFCECIKENHSGKNLVMFHTDHGCHDCSGSGRHGSDLPEDLDIFHFFGGICHE